MVYHREASCHPIGNFKIGALDMTLRLLRCQYQHCAVKDKVLENGYPDHAWLWYVSKYAGAQRVADVNDNFINFNVNFADTIFALDNSLLFHRHETICLSHTTPQSFNKCSWNTGI